MKRCWMTWILACAFWAAPTLALVPLPMADDLAAALHSARVRHVPVLLAFMQKDCPYCARARRHLEPMQASERWRDRAIMLEVDVDSRAKLRDFDGRWTTPHELAQRHGVRVVPTVIVFDDRGEPAADAVKGLLTDDFYAFYLEQALESGEERIARGRR
jgi:thioredoxin-related protein